MGHETIRWDRSTIWAFTRHYLEMVVAMLVGMAALGAFSALVVDLSDRPAIRLVEMAVWMTVPMAGWMRVRGHAWRPCAEMAGAMVVPTAAALAALTTGAVDDADLLLMLEHVVMFPAMLVPMVLRPFEYVGHDHHRAVPATT